jgi:uncharacterized protein YjbI with pentapeptide repeats
MRLRRLRVVGIGVVLIMVTGSLLPASALADATVTCPTVDPTTGTVTPGPTPDVDWAGCDLNGANLYAANLTDANLSGATLTSPSLGEVTLTGANLSDADLSGSSMTYATVENADLTGANLSSADLAGTLLDGSDLADANLASTNMLTQLTGVQSGGITGQPSLPDGYVLRSGYIFGPGVNLAGDNLTGVDLTSLVLTGADLDGLDLAGLNLSGTVLRQADLTGVSLEDANLTGTDLSDDNLVGIDLTGAQLDLTDFIDDNLSHRSFASTGCYQCILTDANLSDDNFTGASLNGVTLAGANMSGADLSRVLADSVIGVPAALPANWAVRSGILIGPGSDLEGVDLQNALLFDLDLAHADLAGANLINADLAGAEFTGANLTGANLTRADLAGAELTPTNAITTTVIWSKATCPDGRGPGKAGCYPANSRIGHGPQLSVPVRAGLPVSDAQLSGSGFKAREVLLVRFGSTLVARVRTSAGGRFGPVKFRVPTGAAAGSNELTATSQAKVKGQSAYAFFTVQADWTQAQFGPTLNAFNSSEHVLSPANVKELRTGWSADLSTSGGGNTAEAGGVIFTTTGSYNSPMLYALSGSTGRKFWSWSDSETRYSVASAPTLAVAADVT